MFRKNNSALIILALLTAFGAAVWMLPRMLHDRIETGLKDCFKDAEVSVGAFSIERPLALGLSDIAVEAPGYWISAPKVTIDRHFNITFFSPRVIIKAVPKTRDAAAAGQSFAINTVELRDLGIELRLPSIKGEIRGSAEIDLKNSQLNFARLEMPSLKSGELKIENILFDLPRSGEPGTLTAEKLSFQKLKVTDIRGDILWHDFTLSVRPIAASWVKGSASGHAEFGTSEPFGYSAELELRELDLDTFTREFKLKNKMSADGKLAGKIKIVGDRTGVGLLEGLFDAGANGGNLVIEDPNFLKYLADNTRQSIVLIEAAFKNYHFDSGSVAVGKKDNGLGLAVKLNGEKGRRDFEINLHDIL
ncbi:MAG: hypothetical protein KBD07_01550 [Candidatus Omnitrophica bacterium]|nr:hypothetical protein [Candidatus Omnitrophota bacterium]